MPSAQLSCFDTTTGWWAECLGVGFVVGRRLIEGGAVPCLSPVVTDFPEISRKFEGLRLELVYRNFALHVVQQKSGPRPICAAYEKSVTQSPHLCLCSLLISDSCALGCARDTLRRPSAWTSAFIQPLNSPHPLSPFILQSVSQTDRGISRSRPALTALTPPPALRRPALRLGSPPLPV